MMNAGSQNTSHQAQGKAQGQAQEKTSQMMGGASNAAHSLKESCQEVKAQAQDAADAVKINVGAHK